jgi:hypothetical protein
LLLLHRDVKSDHAKVGRYPDQGQREAQRYECTPVGLVSFSTFKLESYRMAEYIKCAEGLSAVLGGSSEVELVGFILFVGFASGFKSLV